MTPHTPTTALQEWLSSKMAAFISWVAAILGIGGGLTGVLNATGAFLGAVWLVVQLWNYFTYTLPMNKAKLAGITKKGKDHVVN